MRLLGRSDGGRDIGQAVGVRDHHGRRAAEQRARHAGRHRARRTGHHGGPRDRTVPTYRGCGRPGQGPERGIRRGARGDGQGDHQRDTRAPRARPESITP